MTMDIKIILSSSIIAAAVMSTCVVLKVRYCFSYLYFKDVESVLEVYKGVSTFSFVGQNWDSFVFLLPVEQ